MVTIRIVFIAELLTTFLQPNRRLGLPGCRQNDAVVIYPRQHKIGKETCKIDMVPSYSMGSPTVVSDASGD